jgi:hypothetical protein
MERAGPLDPAGVARILEAAAFPWWIAGGWALDLHIGHAIRPHVDVDVAILRRDQWLLRSHLPDWQLMVAVPGRGLEAWPPGEGLDPPLHAIWARPLGAEPWACEFLINEATETEWVYRRDARISYPLARLLAEGAAIAVLPPEIVLLYKSKNPRREDQIDFDAVLPHLSAHSREWLLAALTLTAPSHEWVGRLAENRG